MSISREGNNFEDIMRRINELENAKQLRFATFARYLDDLKDFTPDENYLFFQKFIEFDPKGFAYANAIDSAPNPEAVSEQSEKKLLFDHDGYLKLCYQYIDRTNTSVPFYQINLDLSVGTINQKYLTGKGDYEKLCQKACAKTIKALESINIDQLSVNALSKILDTAFADDKSNLTLSSLVVNPTITPDVYAKACIKGIKEYNLTLDKFPTGKLKNNLFAVCQIAIKANVENLRILDIIISGSFRSNPYYLGGKPYDQLCEEAVLQNLAAFEHINTNYLSGEDVYGEISLKAAQIDGNALSFIDTRLIPNNDLLKKVYYAAVKQNWMSLHYVKPGLVDEQFYKDICKMAVEQDPAALGYVNFDKITDKVYKHDLLWNIFQKNPDSFKSNPLALENLLIHCNDDEKLLVMKQLTVESILESNCSLYKLLPKSEDTENKFKNFLKNIRHVVITGPYDHEVEDSFAVYANKEFNDPSKSRKGKTARVNVRDLEETFNLIKENNHNEINLVLLSHFNEGANAIAGLRIPDINNILEKHNQINRVTLLGCNTTAQIENQKLAAEEEILGRYEAEKSKESHINKCGLIMIGREPTQEEINKVLKKNDAAFFLVQIQKGNEKEYKMIYAEKNKQETYSLNETQVAMLKDAYNNKKPFKFPGKNSNPIPLQNSEQKPILLDYDDRVDIKDILQYSAPGYSQTSPNYQERKKQMPSLSSAEFNVNDLETSKIRGFLSDLSDSINKNAAIKQAVTVKGYNGLVSVDTQKNAFIVSKNFLYKHKKYTHSFFGTGQDNIDREMLAKAKRQQSHIKSVKVKIPGKP